MNAALSLPDLKARGIELWAEGETLRYRALAGTVTPDLLAALKALKPELLQALRQPRQPANCTPNALPAKPEAAHAAQSLETNAREACKGLGGYITLAAFLAKLAPEDLAELKTCPDPLPFLRSFAIACVWTDFRKNGIAPPGWDKPAHCERCGPVYLWASIYVAGCPWCWNRRHGVKIPRPQTPSEV